MSGGRVARARRSAGGVSPERMPTLTSGSGSPRRTDSCRMPVSGLRRLRSTSTASAFSGDTYSTRQRFWGSAGGGLDGQPVQRGEERGQRLAGAGRGDHQHVRALADRPPGPGLGRGGRGEGPREPAAGRGGEAVEGSICGAGHAPILHPATDNGPDLRKRLGRDGVRPVAAAADGAGFRRRGRPTTQKTAHHAEWGHGGFGGAGEALAVHGAARRRSAAGELRREEVRAAHPRELRDRGHRRRRRGVPPRGRRPVRGPGSPGSGQPRHPAHRPCRWARGLAVRRGLPVAGRGGRDRRRDHHDPRHPRLRDPRRSRTRTRRASSIRCCGPSTRATRWPPTPCCGSP